MSARAAIATYLFDHQGEDVFTLGEGVIAALAEAGFSVVPMNAPAEPETALYRAVEETPNGWCNVVGPTVPEHAGPWRYLWEAQEYADELNAALPAPTGGPRNG